MTDLLFDLFLEIKLTSYAIFFMKKILKYNEYEHTLSNFCHNISKVSRQAIKISNHDQKIKNRNQANLIWNLEAHWKKKIQSEIIFKYLHSKTIFVNAKQRYLFCKIK